ncbi:hypothetical protein [Neobacillus drentensis]|uniref:hypothetical protein n=1 Tax=Neobacillus drentensis TaxID=220684 RepID=UPI000826B5B9|nr:hypothetical protein [Neobacillus drentensis]
MKRLKRKICFTLLLYISLCLYHFIIHKSFNWIENAVLTLLLVVFGTFFNWAFSNKGKMDKS